MLSSRCASSASSLASTSRRQWPACSTSSCNSSLRNAGLRPGRATRVQIICMAHPRRIAKVAAQVQREISDMLHYDSVLQNALAPERSTGQDLQLSVVPSITHVYVSNDLQVVKLYVSIYSDDYGKKRAMNNLKKLEPYVRREMGQRVPLRLTPEYRFEYDDSVDEMELVQQVIGEEDVARFKRELAAEQGEEVEEEVLIDDAQDAEGFFALGDDGDEEGFFGEQEYEEVSSADVFNRPGPFDDLFSGDGDQLVQSGSKAGEKEEMGEGGRKKGRRGKGAQSRG